MHQKLLKNTTIYCFVFFIIAMLGMIYFDANKIIVIADSSESLSSSDLEMKDNLMTQYQLLMENEKKYMDEIVIPLEETVKAENVLVENHYIDKELWIGIDGANAEFYSQQYVVGDLQNIQDGGYDIVGDILWIKLSMSKIFEYESTMNNGKLSIKMQEPDEVYDKIIVIDAGHGGEEKGSYVGRVSEKNIALDVLLILQKNLKDSGIKVYYTRTADETLEDEKRVELANNVGADMVISLHTAYDEDMAKKGVTTIYNGDYFIQKFDSIALSDILEQSVARETGAKANGLQEATDTDVLVTKAQVPVAQINLGYLSNEDDRKSLQDEEYQELIANGIYNAIMEIYEEKLNE